LDDAAGERFFTQWYRTAMRSKLEPVKKVARTIKAHLVNLLTYFRRPITNALTEGFNSKIQAIKADARGFRRFENYRARIFFFCGKLDLVPHFSLAAITLFLEQPTIMTSLTFTKREITYLLVALSTYRKALHGQIGEDMGDEYDDILMAEHLIKRINEAEKESVAQGKE